MNLHRIVLSSQVKLILSTQIQNSPPPNPALARWMSSFSFWIRLSRESTTNKCRMNSRCRGSRGLRRASDEARFSGSILSLQLPRPSPILISLSWLDVKLTREFSLQSMVSTIFDGCSICSDNTDQWFRRYSTSSESIVARKIIPSLYFHRDYIQSEQKGRSF